MLNLFIISRKFDVLLNFFTISRKFVVRFQNRERSLNPTYIQLIFNLYQLISYLYPTYIPNREGSPFCSTAAFYARCDFTARMLWFDRFGPHGAFFDVPAHTHTHLSALPPNNLTPPELVTEEKKLHPHTSSYKNLRKPQGRGADTSA